MIDELKFSSDARDEGAALALAAETLKHELVWAITKAARSFPSFTSDEVWHLLREIQVTTIEHPNTLGATFLMAARQGIIRNTGRTQKTVRAGCNRHAVAVWDSLIFRSES